MKTAEPAGTRDLPDSLRCRLSDGRKWRCSHPVMPGLSFCKYHRHNRNPIFNPATMFKITKPLKSSHQRPLRRMEEEQNDGLITMDQNEEPQEILKLPITGKIKAADPAILVVEAPKQAAQDVDHDTKPITPARSGVVREDFPSHPPGFPADSGVVRIVERATLEGVMESLRRSQEQMEAMRMSQEQGRLQLDELLKDNNRLWDKIHYLENNNKHYKEKISSLFSELTTLKQQPPSSPMRPQQKCQKSGASSRDPRMKKEIGQIHSMIAQINSHMAHSSIILSQVTDVVAHLGRDCEN